MLAAIRNGSFNPDSTRSGMLTPGALPYLGGTPLPEAGLPIATTPAPSGDKRLPESKLLLQSQPLKCDVPKLHVYIPRAHTSMPKT